jgi:hypothetical protein
VTAAAADSVDGLALASTWAFRHAVVNGDPVEEFRAGMTFGVRLPEIKGRRAG